MHIILGGTGQVGSATARVLLDEGQDVTIVTRDENHGEHLKIAGAKIATADIRDVDALRDLFRTGKRAFLLNPPADPSTDTDTEERKNAAAIISALDGSGLEKVVVQSTYGAFQGQRCGDLTVLYELEQKLLAQSIPAAINRGAYYMSNWIGMVDAAGENCTLPCFFPSDLVLPMVAPSDLGQVAARRLMTPTSDVGVQHIEGPQRYTARDVADAFADTLSKVVDIEEIPRDALEATFAQFGFSEKSATSYACMTCRLIDDRTDTTDKPKRGTVSLREYVRSVLGSAE